MVQWVRYFLPSLKTWIPFPEPCGGRKNELPQVVLQSPHAHQGKCMPPSRHHMKIQQILRANMRMTSKYHKDEKLKAPSPGKDVEQLELSFTVERNGNGLHYRKKFIIYMPFLRFIQVKKNYAQMSRDLINYHVKLEFKYLSVCEWIQKW